MKPLNEYKTPLTDDTIAAVLSNADVGWFGRNSKMIEALLDRCRKLEQANAALLAAQWKMVDLLDESGLRHLSRENHEVFVAVEAHLKEGK
jgi:glutamine phosphoribosylpyrophosphate amidotransferase